MIKHLLYEFLNILNIIGGNLVPGLLAPANRVVLLVGSLEMFSALEALVMICHLWSKIPFVNNQRVENLMQ